MNTGGSSKPSGDLNAKLIKGRRRADWKWRIRNFLRWNFLLGHFQNRLARAVSHFAGVLTVTSELRATAFVLQEDDRSFYAALRRQYELNPSDELLAEIESILNRRTAVDYGLLGMRVVTSAFVAFVTDQLQTETSVFGDFKYHDSGVGTTAEANGDTGIETTDGESRATGTQTESAANAYRSVGTISYTTTKAITEHGLFNDSSAGTLMDRTVFSAINVVNGDSIQFTYTLTLNAGG